MRDKLWRYLMRRVPEGTILPRWALAVRAILFPLDTFYWRMSETRGYQWRTDSWVIGGVRFSNTALEWLAESQGENFKVTSHNGVITVRHIPEPPTPTREDAP